VAGGRRKEEGGRRKEEGGRRKEEGGRRKAIMNFDIQMSSLASTLAANLVSTSYTGN
jgi:hypothetical protein